jgi:hypothetical protein
MKKGNYKTLRIDDANTTQTQTKEGKNKPHKRRSTKQNKLVVKRHLGVKEGEG